MSCCAAAETNPASRAAGPSEAEPWVRQPAPGLRCLDLLAPGIHCGGCISRIEKALLAEPGVTHARVNLSTRRIAIEWREDAADPDALIATLRELGYEVRPFDAEKLKQADDKHDGELLRAMAVAGFAAGNIMLLSVSVWSGAEAATRDLFHWISALIALPAVAYAGRPFFRAAWGALRHGRLNMEVPISLAVLLAAGMSLYETAIGGATAYFDAAVMLLFFLLVGRYLDQRMRTRARSTASELLALSARAATLVLPGGGRRAVPVEQVAVGDEVFVAAGERLPVDGRILTGTSEFDRALVTGESVPERLGAGAEVHAGTLNLTGPVTVTVTAVGEDTLLAEIVRLMEAAEQGRARHVRLADRAARVYAPLVHLVALATFLGWMWVTGGDWHASLFAAIAVLIITCPCALGLAVPAVQVVASAALMRRAVMVKDGLALERLAEIDTVVFDKTGTLTVGRPRLLGEVDAEALALAAGLARQSTHPLSRALAEAAAERGIEPIIVGDVHEVPGAGLEGDHAGKKIRLGRAAWCGALPDAGRAEPGRLELWLAEEGRPPTRFALADTPRADASAVVERLQAMGLRIELLSGDRAESAAAIAEALGIKTVSAPVTPAGKVEHLKALAASGARVAMVGDGLNDAPALAAAHVSLSPGSASDIARTAASAVFMTDRLAPVADAIAVARRAKRLVMQNFALAALYNLIAIPLAVLGYASPLVAALAMSSSSIVVTANALRLARGTPGGAPSSAARPSVTAGAAPGEALGTAPGSTS